MPEVPRPDLVRKAICAQPRAQITWRDSAKRKLHDDPDLCNACLTQEGVNQFLREYICKQKGKCDPQKETDEKWLDRSPSDPWLYYVIVPEIFPKGIFIKIRLLWDEGDRDDEAYVLIANIHQEH
jgi:hypothetical protein